MCEALERRYLLSGFEVVVQVRKAQITQGRSTSASARSYCDYTTYIAV